MDGVCGAREYRDDRDLRSAVSRAWSQAADCLERVISRVARGQEGDRLYRRRRVWSIAVSGVGNDLRFGTPQRLFSANLNLRGPGGPGIPARRLAVSRDGSRFFFPLRQEQPEANVIHVRTGAWVNQARSR